MNRRLHNPTEWRRGVEIGVDGVVADRDQLVAVEVASEVQWDARSQREEADGGEVADPEDATIALQET